MTWIAVICFGVCIGIALTVCKRGADLFSPSRVYLFVWALAIGLAELKLSAFQHEWERLSWLVLLTGIGSFLAGTYVAYVLNLSTTLVPLREMRTLIRREEVHEGRLFWFIVASVAVYAIGYSVNYLIRGFLPIFDVHRGRLEFNVTGVTLFLFSVPYILFFIMLYFFLVRGNRGRKGALVGMGVFTVGSTLLLLSRFQLFMPFMICTAFLYYASRTIRWKTVAPLLVVMSVFMYWVSSVRASHLVASYIHHISRMKFGKEYAFFTEPYMYVVMNLENFARTVKYSDYHTYGWLTLDPVTAVTGLKYWLKEYFSIERLPFLNSGYNTYPSLWWFFMDFGVVGMACIALLLGLWTGLGYYRMRHNPTVKNVTAYAVMFFVAFVATYTFPPANLWFVLNVIVMYVGLRWALKPAHAPDASAPMPGIAVGGGAG